MTRFRTSISILILILFTILIFLFNIHVLSGTSIQNPQTLAQDLVGKNKANPPAIWINQWMWEQNAPKKFRILGNLMVWSTWKQIYPGDDIRGFYNSYVLGCFIFLSATIIAVYFYLKFLFNSLEITGNHCDMVVITGCLLFMVSPPIFTGFKFPVQTGPNDLLGYFLLTTAMIALICQRPVIMCIISSIAVFCWETTLLVPCIYFIVDRNRTIKKAVLSGIPLLIWLIYRIIFWEGFDPVRDAKHNLEFLPETICFFLMIFGVLWIAATGGYLEIKRRSDIPEKWIPLVISFPICCILVICINLFLAKIRIMKIGYILFIFMIPFATAWFYSNRALVKKVFYNVSCWVYWTGTAVIIWLMYIRVTPPMPSSRHEYFIRTFNSFYGNGVDGWTGIFPYYLWIFLAVIPLFIIWLLQHDKHGSSMEDKKSRPGSQPGKTHKS